jgi:Bacteriocin-protection, YdeI or OmpD-Associated/Domain of unknown function (DUF1905)
MMRFRSYVEPAEPIRDLEVLPEVVEALGAGKRPAVTFTINRHSWKSRVAIICGRYLLGLSNANRKAAGVATGDEVEVEVELDAEPRVVAEPADFARALDADPAVRTAYDRLSYSHKRQHVHAIESAKKPQTRSRLIEKALAMLRGQESAGAVRPAPRLEATTPDIFDTITPAMARNEHGGQHCCVRAGNPHGAAPRGPNREVRATADLALEHVTVPHKSSATKAPARCWHANPARRLNWIIVRS